MHDLGPLVGMVAVVGFYVIPIIAVIGHFGSEAWKAWLEIGLKRDMVARGYSAAEIIEVIAAERGSKVKSSLPNVPPAKPIKQAAYSP